MITKKKKKTSETKDKKHVFGLKDDDQKKKKKVIAFSQKLNAVGIKALPFLMDFLHLELLLAS